MIGFIVLLVIVFFFLTIGVLMKTARLLETLKSGDSRSSDEHFGPAKDNSYQGIGLLVLWIVSVIAVIYSFLDAKKYFLPEAASQHGKETDLWFWISMAVITVAFFLVNSLLFFFAYKYRFNPNRKVSFYSHNNRLEVLWTSVPAVVMAGLVFSGLRVWNKITDEAPSDAEVIEIMGKQFGWTVRYPGSDHKLGSYSFKLMDDAGGNPLGVSFSDVNSFDDFANSSELHIPKGKPVLLKIRSRDVLHSVFIPHMRVKMDAVPGMPTKFWFIPEKTTTEMRKELSNDKFNYEIACTEICGRSHFGMKLLLVVDEPTEYEKWKSSQKTLLTENPALIDLVPVNLKARASRYLPVEEVVETAEAVVDSL